MDFGIRNKVAFVSGGSKGMVGAAARMLAVEGCTTTLIPRFLAPWRCHGSDYRRANAQGGFSAKDDCPRFGDNFLY